MKHVPFFGSSFLAAAAGAAAAADRAANNAADAHPHAHPPAHPQDATAAAHAHVCYHGRGWTHSEI